MVRGLAKCLNGERGSWGFYRREKGARELRISSMRELRPGVAACTRDTACLSKREVRDDGSGWAPSVSGCG